MSFIITRSGKHVNFVATDPSQIDIDDIAEGLSKECRFGGHCEGFYSVAQHSIHVANMLPPELRLEGLLHDATEAYMRDIPSPLKDLVSDYIALEHKLDLVIRAKYGLPAKRSEAVKVADLIALATEKRDFLSWAPEWPMLRGITPTPRPLTPWNWEYAKRKFLELFTELSARRLK